MRSQVLTSGGLSKNGKTEHEITTKQKKKRLQACSRWLDVPTDAEWTTLENFLNANGYNWDGTTTGNKFVKSMAAKTDWESFYWLSGTPMGYPSNGLSQNNASGMSILPGGGRWDNGFFLSQKIH